MQVKPLREEEPNRFWRVEIRFSTKPPSKERCNTTPIEDPLLEPQKVSGTFVKKTEEGLKDRFGLPIENSSHEPLIGPQNEWDADGGDTVTIEQNVADLELDVLAGLKNAVNDAPLWGLPARCIKFSSYSWSKEFYGTCFAYYKRRLEFDVNINTFDRDMLDEGTKVLHGYWDSTSPNWVVDVLNDGTTPDPNNPTHFDRAIDRQGNPIHVILDGAGKPFVPVAKITTCTQCPTGAPANWTISEIRTNPETLAYTSGCTWTYTASGTITLTYDGASSKWKVTDTGWGGSEWTLAAASWKCMGPNTMTRTTGTLGPLTISLANKDVPGSRHVEKYKNGNLLALNIPTTF
jgi:hypothetical protein